MSELRSRKSVDASHPVKEEIKERNRVCYTFKDRRAIKHARLISRGFSQFVDWAKENGDVQVDEESFGAFQEWVESLSDQKKRDLGPALQYISFRNDLHTQVGQDTLKVYATSDHFGNLSAKQFYTHHGFRGDEPLLRLACLEQVMQSGFPSSMTQKAQDEDRFVREEDYASYSSSAEVSEHGYLSDELVRALRLHRFLERSNQGAGILFARNGELEEQNQQLELRVAELMLDRERLFNMENDFYRIDKVLGLISEGDDGQALVAGVDDEHIYRGQHVVVNPYELPQEVRHAARDFDARRAYAFRISRDFEKFRKNELLTIEGNVRLWDMVEPSAAQYAEWEGLGVPMPRPEEYGYRK